jgi:hypothetical protein
MFRFLKNAFIVAEDADDDDDVSERIAIINDLRSSSRARGGDAIDMLETNEPPSRDDDDDLDGDDEYGVDDNYATGLLDETAHQYDEQLFDDPDLHRVTTLLHGPHFCRFSRRREICRLPIDRSSRIGPSELITAARQRSAR